MPSRYKKYDTYDGTAARAYYRISPVIEAAALLEIFRWYTFRHFAIIIILFIWIYDGILYFYYFHFALKFQSTSSHSRLWSFHYIIWLPISYFISPRRDYAFTIAYLPWYGYFLIALMRLLYGLASTNFKYLLSDSRNIRLLREAPRWHSRFTLIHFEVACHDTLIIFVTFHFHKCYS